MVIARARRTRVHRALLLAGAIAVQAVGIVLASPRCFAEDAVGIIDEIVVTARKLPETLLEVPLSIQVLGGDHIDATGNTNLLGLQFEIPGLVITNAGMFGSNLALRGVTDHGGGSLAVAAHLDAVILGRPGLTMARLFDVERIEVLKGPQGTLYGRNSTGGSINIVSRAPDDSFGASVELGLGSFGLERADGALNVPVGTSAMRIAVAAANSDGYVRNAVDDRRFAEDDFIAARLSWRYSPSIPLTVDVRLQRVDDDGGSDELWMPRPDFLPDTGDAHLTAVTHPDPYLHLLNDVASITAVYQLDRISAHSITGYARNRTRNVDDCAGLPPLRGCVRTALPNTYVQWSQEFRLQSTVEAALDWVAGIYFLDSDAETNYFVSVPAFGPVPRDDRHTIEDERAIAIFGQLHWRLTDASRLTAGLRVGQDRARMSTIGFGAMDYPVRVDGDDAWDNTAWRIGVDHAVGDATLLFASVASGYKSGGLAPVVLPGGELDRYASEQVVSYEAGVNVSPGSGRASLRAAAFRYDFTDMQVSTTAIIDDDIVTVTDNASRSRIDGLDVSVLLNIDRYWTISAGTVWLPERHYLEFITADGSEDVSGHFLNRAPEWTTTATIEFRHPLFGGEVSARLDASYRSLVYFTRTNSPDESQEGFSLANLYVRYESASKGWYAYMTVRNLADQAYFTQVFLQSAVGRPRNWEAGFGLRY